MGEIRKQLSIKIVNEMRKSNKLKVLSKDDNLSFNKSVDLYKQANDISNKIQFFRKLDKALKKQD